MPVPRQPAANNQARDDRRSVVAAELSAAQPRWLAPLAARPQLTLTLLTMAVLLPFIGKPLNIDDPMYVWAAEQIRSHPLDFYGFTVFWAGAELPMPIHMQNPPLASYFIALVSLVAGWSATAMHVAFMLPAIGLVLGTYQLARIMCRLSPVLAGMLTILTPVFVLCANTITNDVLLTCFWVWAVVCWDRGLRNSHWPNLLTSSLLIAAACLTKYPGVNLIPLLAAYTIARRAPWRWLLFLLLPIAALLGYEVLTRAMYSDVTLSGGGLLAESMAYARQVRARREAEPLLKSFITFGFTGACMAPVLLFSPILWRWRGVLAGLGMCAVVLAILATTDIPRIQQLRMDGRFNWSLAIQLSLWTTVGVGIMCLTIADLWRRRNAESLLLTLWVFGTFAFTGIINWSVNGRSLLPMAPAVAIIIVRRMDDAGMLNTGWRRSFVPVGLGASAALCVTLAWADTRFAFTGRNAAEVVVSDFKPTWRALWFQGHWGFQHYMQRGGGQPFVVKDKPIRVSDLVVVPLFNTNTMPLNESIADPVDDLAFDVIPFVSTMNVVMGAGFYSDAAGPLPFVFGSAPQEQYRVYRIKQEYVPPPSTDRPKP